MVAFSDAVVDPRTVMIEHLDTPEILEEEVGSCLGATAATPSIPVTVSAVLGAHGARDFTRYTNEINHSLLEITDNV
jgi:hypothetical protein